jgi:hypothetical protein
MEAEDEDAMSESVSEDWINELAGQIGARTRISYRTAAPPFGVIDPVSLVHEAIDWLGDARSFNSLRRRAWRQLLDDLKLSVAELGPELRAQLEPLLSSMTPLLQLAKDAGASERTQASKAIETLLSSLDTGQAVVAAWHDLLAAYRDESASPELCDLRESQLAAVAKLRGFDWAFLPGQLGRTLAGRGDLLEGFPEKIEDLREAVDDRSLHERQATCDTYLEKVPAEADVVVWVAISELAIWRWVIELDRVTFYDGTWWSAVVKAGAGQLPAELVGRPQIELDVVFFGLLNRDAEAQPFVVARVELGRCRIPAAIEQAQRVALGVLNAAGLRSGELTGVPFEGGVVFSDGQIRAERGFSLDSDFALGRAEKINERAIGQALTELEPQLLDALLLDDKRLALAMTSVEWLKQTKGLTPSQQLGLSLRAIEQVFSEADERHWRDTVYDHLCYPWSLSRIGNTLADIVYRAIMSLSGAALGVPTQQQRDDFLDVKQFVMGGDSFIFRRALERLAWLRERVDPATRTARDLRFLEARFADGPAAAAWLSELEREFARNLNRTHRLRNGILHGYPLQLDIVAANSAFARSISIHAVHELIDATAGGQDLATHMRGRRDDYQRRRKLLEGGAIPADAFGWTAGT